MTDEHKSYKSKTVELFGNKYEVSNKSSSSINSKSMLCLGFIKYHFKKINKIITTPILNFYDYIVSNELFEPFMIISSVLLFGSLFSNLIFTLAVIDDNIRNCNNECEIYKLYCKDYIGNTKECIRQHIYYYQEYYKLYMIGLNFGLIVLKYLIIGSIILGILIKLVYFRFQLLILLHNHMYNNASQFNEQIPEFELV